MMVPAQTVAPGASPALDARIRFRELSDPAACSGHRSDFSIAHIPRGDHLGRSQHLGGEG